MKQTFFDEFHEFKIVTLFSHAAGLSRILSILKAEKSTWIQKVVDFVGLTDFNMEEVIDQISVANTIARRKAKFEAAG